MIHTPSYPIELADKIAPYYKEAREGNLSSAMQLAALTNHHEVQIIKTLIALGAPRKLYDKALLAEAEKMREAHHSQQGIDDMRKEFLRLEMGISELIKSNTFQTEVD